MMNLRDAHWIPVQASASGEALSASPAKPAVPAVGAPAPPAKVSSFQLGRSVNGKKVARVMKDGKRLCQDFQEGRCAEGTSAPTSIGAASCSRARECAAPASTASRRSRPEGAPGGGGPPWGLLRNRLLPTLRLWRICLRGLTRRYQRLSSFVGGGACQWIIIKLDASHDLSNPLRQDSLREQLGQVDFIAAAFDCSTKSRAREIFGPFQDGRPAPKPLRSEALPEGLAGLSKQDQARVDQQGLCLRAASHSRCSRAWSRRSARESR